MSFQDLAGASTPSPAPQSGRSSDIARGIFELNTSVARFRRLVDAIGTAKDNIEHRQKLANLRQSLSKQVKEISAKLKVLSNRIDPNVSLSKRVEDSKLAREFQAVLLDFQKAQRLAAEREVAYVPAPSPCHQQTSSVVDEDAAPPDMNQERERLTREQKRQGIFLLENEIAFSEAIIEEREKGINEIEYQIGQVNEMFRDLAVLIHEQGVMIDDIDTKIDAAATTTADAKVQVSKASKSIKSKSSWCWWLLVILVVVIVIIILIIFL